MSSKKHTGDIVLNNLRMTRQGMLQKFTACFAVQDKTTHFMSHMLCRQVLAKAFGMSKAEGYMQTVMFDL